ncbi:MAG: DUF1583 domain-containing protein [Pirellulaceae bacterium]
MQDRGICRVAVFLYSMLLVFSHTVALTAQQAQHTGVGAQAPHTGVRQELTRVMSQLAAGAERVTMGGRMGSAGDSLPDVVNLCRAARFLPAFPAAERYQLLKDWILPSAPGALTRNAMNFAPVAFPPEIFFSSVESAQPVAVPSDEACGAGRDGVINFMELLIAAAVEAEKLDELCDATEQAGRSCEMARTLHMLAAIARQRAQGLTPRVEDVSDRLQAQMNAPGQVRTKLWPPYLVARAWMRDDAYGEQGERLAELLMVNSQDAQQRPLLSHLTRDRAVSQVRRKGGKLAAGADPGLSLWHPGGYYFASGSDAGTWPGWWVEREGCVRHVSGPEVSPLYFDYPLTGHFEFSADGYWDRGAESAVQFGRFIFEPCGRGDKAQVLSIGEQESAKRPVSVEMHRGYHRLTIRVTPERVLYLFNDAVVFDDRAPSPTTPWLALFARSTRSTAWCNLQITGDPQIPAEVPLVCDDRMEGWMSPIYRERLPRQIIATDSQGVATVLDKPDPVDCDWTTREGVLHGRSVRTAGTKVTSQAWLTYHRPLRSGDTISYEFLYKPGETMVYPSIGRIATILEPDLVRLHWITDIPHMTIGGLRPDNAVTVSDEQRGTRPLGLLPDTWNRMTVVMAEDHVMFQLNGSEIYQRRLTASDSRMFGLFYYKTRMAAEVRSIVLAGNWPDHLTPNQRAVPAARSDIPETREQQLGRAALVDERWLYFRNESP